MKDLLMIGASGHGRVVADLAEQTGRYREVFFLDDCIERIGSWFAGRKVLGTSAYAMEHVKDYEIFIAVGHSAVRERLMEQLEAVHAVIPVLVHPSAVVARDVLIGSGSVVMAGAVVNSGAHLGKGVIVNTCSSVDHDCVVEDFVHIAVGAHVAGTVHIGRHTWIGAGATVSNNLTIVDQVMLGAGAVAVKDLLSSGTYAGVPAKRMADREERS